MYRTFSSVRLFVAATALMLAVVAAPAAQAQSVKGSGTIRGVLYGTTKVHVNVYVGSDGTVHGTVRVGTGKSETAVSLVVVGNKATVTTESGGWYVFTDNGDGSVEPDYFQEFFHGSPFLSGGITVIP